MKFNFKSFLPHLVAIIAFLVICTVYFLPQLDGKKLRQTDTLQFQNIAAEALEYRENGENILWTNAIFGGMPTYQISAKTNGNLTGYIEKILQLKIAAPIGLFLSGLFACYIAFLIVGIDKWLAIIGSILCTFNPNNLVLFEAGHQTKVRAVIFSVLIIVGVIKLFRKKYLLGGLTFAAGLALSIGANHYQMTYYVGLTLLVFGLIAGIQMLISKEFTNLTKIIGFGILATIIAAGTSTSRILPTYEYSKSTMRGNPILEKTSLTKNSSSSSDVKGLNWDYANQWSNGFIDVMGIFIPGVAGGGSNEPVATNGPTNKFMKANRMRKMKYGPMYWGKLPFTSGPAYMGATSIFLFFLSLFVLNARLRIWGIAAFILTIMISLGKNLEWFNHIIFDHLPLFNKFRAPSSVTSVTTVIVAILGMLGLNKILTSEYNDGQIKKVLKYILISVGSLSLICLFYGILGPGWFDFESSSDARYAQQKGLAEAFQAERASIMRRDAFRSMFLILGTAGVIYLFLKKKISKIISIALITALILIDLFPVNSRYVSHSSFVNKREVKKLSAERPVDKQILQDKDPYYRVHDASLGGQAYQSASSSKLHKTVGGYHAAKLQRFADLIDLHLQKGNQAVFNMLNTKYFILGSPGQESVKQNAGALGNAWFVKNVSVVETHRAEIEALTGLDTKSSAVIHSEFSENLGNVSSGFSDTGSIKLTSYHPEKLIYSSNNPEAGMAIFSEIWYGPNLGWKLYIDDVETPILRANYVLRAAKIPAGQHEIVMEFRPKTFYVGEILSVIFSFIIIGGSLYLLYRNFRGENSGKMD